MKPMSKQMGRMTWALVLAASVGLAACQASAPAAITTQSDTTAAQSAQGGQTVQQTASAQQVTRVGTQQQPGTFVLPTALPTRAVVAETSIAVDGVLSTPTPLITAAFDTTGIVTAIHVAAGQKVTQGEVLAEISDSELQTALSLAQEQLMLKQAEIAQSLAPASDSDISTAKANLSAAYAAYNTLKKGADATDVEAALRSLNQAKNSLYSTQLNRDTICHFTPGKPDPAAEAIAKKEPDCKEAEYNVQQAELRVKNAEQQYTDAQQPATQAELASAWSNVLQAQASLASLQNGASDQDKKVYDLQLQKAQLTVERAQRDLTQAKLVSPCNCVVQEVNIAVGSSSQDGITLLDIGSIKFYTSNLNERDVVKLAAGQKVSLRFKAFDQAFSGSVESVLPESSGESSTVALYTAVIALAPTDATLLPGMTGQAEISLK